MSRFEATESSSRLRRLAFLLLYILLAFSAVIVYAKHLIQVVHIPLIPELLLLIFILSISWFYRLFLFWDFNLHGNSFKVCLYYNLFFRCKLVVGSGPESITYKFWGRRCSEYAFIFLDNEYKLSIFRNNNSFSCVIDDKAD